MPEGQVVLKGFGVTIKCWWCGADVLSAQLSKCVTCGKVVCDDCVTGHKKGHYPK